MNRNHSLAAIFVVLATSALGIILAPSIPNSVFPEITFHRAIILADASELPPEQMLVAVTRPLEEAAYGVVGTSRVRSTTTRGSSEIDVDFSESVDPTTSYELLNAALGEVRSHLPPDTKVDTRLLTTGTFPIIDMSMSSKVRNLAEITDVAFYDVVPSLHRIPGVYRVEMVGAKYREYVVSLDPQRMLAHAISPNDVVNQLGNQNIVASAGRVMDEHRMLLTVVTARLHSPQELEAVPVGTQNGTPTYIRDIATVGLGIQEDYIRTSCEHGPAVLVGISRDPDGDTETIAARVQELIKQFRVRYPDVQFSLSYNQATLVTDSIGSVQDAIILGLILSIVVVLMFTMSPLSAIVAAIVVPCTVAMTMVVMKATGMTFNMMTLGGMAAGVGLFIDDAIVMIEAVHRAHSTGTPADEAVSRAVSELGRPLIASTLTVIVVFMPLIFVSGVTGVFFRSLAVTMGGGLAISLFLALFFTPALEHIVGRWRRKGRPPGRPFGIIRDAFLVELRPFVRFPILAPVAFLLCAGAAVMLYRTIGTDYLPPLDEGAFTLDYTTPPQSTLADTTAMLDLIEHILRTTPEVVAFSRRTGTQLGFFLTESDRGDMSVRLRSDRTRSIDQVMESIRERILSTVPGVRVEFSQVLQDLIGDLSGTPEPIEVKVFGPDQATIQRTAREVAELLNSVPGAVDVFDGVVLSNPEQEIVINEAAADRYGLSASDIQAALLTVVEGTVATSLMVGDRLIDVRVRYPDKYHTDLRNLSQVLLRSSSGQIVPLDTVATMRWVGEQPELDRERMRPVIHVTGRLENTDLGTALAKLQAGLAHMTLAPGVSLELGGLYAEQQKAFAQLGLVMIAALVATMLILIWEFGRLTPALGVLAAALASLAGSFAALNLAGITLNISSFMGVIMVAGITAKNGILLLDHAEQGIANGELPVDALVEAASIRIRPILMTTLATAAGLAPLALGLGAGAKVQQPLAIAVIGGLVLAMLLSSAIAGGIYLLGTRRPRGLLRAATSGEPAPE